MMELDLPIWAMWLIWGFVIAVTPMVAFEIVRRFYSDIVFLSELLALLVATGIFAAAWLFLSMPAGLIAIGMFMLLSMSVIIQFGKTA